jgi:hypothetical protein
MSLIQKIRAEQVLEEEGLDLPIKVVHSNDVETYIGDRKYTLVFPKFLLNYDNDKTIKFIFIGLLNNKRSKFLHKFPNALIIDSDRGRRKEVKRRDESYFNLMSKSKFVLCPNGDFVWTYRFFEAIIFKAIPIIQNFHSLYNDYKFYTLNNNFIYDIEMVKFNLEKIKKEMFWNQ